MVLENSHHGRDIASAAGDSGAIGTRLPDRVRFQALGTQCEIQYAAADPEAYTLQFVVEAARSGEDQLGEQAAVEWPTVGGDHSAAARITELEQERDNLQAEVDAWHDSKLVRLTRPLRSVYGRARRYVRGSR